MVRYYFRYGHYADNAVAGAMGISHIICRKTKSKLEFLSMNNEWREFNAVKQMADLDKLMQFQYKEYNVKLEASDVVTLIQKISAIEVLEDFSQYEKDSLEYIKRTACEKLISLI
jgi:hypothetical protein